MRKRISLIFLLAWRNTWRNRRRTFITMAAMFFSVVLAIMMRALQLGTYDQMIHNLVGTYMGQVQLHARGYHEDPNPEHSFTLSETLQKTLRELPASVHYTLRLESFMLALSDSTLKVAMLTGINPQQEANFGGLHQRVSQGRYLRDIDEKGALLAEGLAQRLKLQVGDTLVVLGQGYRATMAAGRFPIVGLVHFGSPELNKQLIYLPLAQAQRLLSMPGRYTTLAFRLQEQSPEEFRTTLTQRLGADSRFYEILSWTEMLPELKQAIEVDSAGGLLIISVLYMVVAFVFFGTLVMMTAERMREFGVLVAVGMNKLLLAATVYIETVLVAMLGVVSGSVAAIPLIAYFYHHPIRLSGELAKTYESYGFEPVMMVSTDPGIFFNQGLVIYGIATVLSLYPLIQIMRLQAVEAMRK